MLSVGDSKPTKRAPRVVYIHHRCNDTHNPNDPTYGPGAEFDQAVVCLLKQQGKRVLVHCKMGTNRSVAVIVAATIVARKDDSDDAAASCIDYIVDMKKKTMGEGCWSYKLVNHQA